MSEDPMRKLLWAQRRRAVATILGHAEREVYCYLEPEEQKQFRKKVIEAVDSYHELMLDVLGSTADPYTLIEPDTLQLLADVRDELRKSRDQARSI